MHQENEDDLAELAFVWLITSNGIIFVVAYLFAGDSLCHDSASLASLLEVFHLLFEELDVDLHLLNL